MSSHLVQSPEEYAESMRVLGTGMLTGNRLPARVFGGERRFRVGEFDDLMGEPLWEVVRAAARAAGDERIIAAILEPSPEYFHRHFGYYGVLALDTGDPAEAYLELLDTEPPDSPADGFIYNSEVIAVCGPSRRWQLWAQRSLGVAILATEPGLALEETEMRWFSAADALALIAQNFLHKRLPPEIAEAFTRNYLEALEAP
jgi:hypothetical protein